jgi:GxxExxY protein
VSPNELTRLIIGAAIEVHRELGPGKVEAAYENALARELGLRGLPYQSQKPVPVVYKGIKLECGYRIDLLVTDTVVVEVKSVECFHPVHRAQVITYLKLGGWKLALLLNFNTAILKQGIERFILGFDTGGDNSSAVQRRDELKFMPSSRIEPSLHSSMNTGEETERLAREIIAAGLEVHRCLGPGLLASAYRVCLCHELHLRGISFETNWTLELSYKGTLLAQSDEIDLLVGGRVAVHADAVSKLQSVHHAELLSQLRLGRWKLGLLINFNTTKLADGLRRVILS